MATIKSHTDLSQSLTLSKILCHETADMFFADILVEGKHKYFVHSLETYFIKTFKDTEVRKSNNLNFIPCWSLAALLDVLPHIQEFYPIISKINDKYVCRYKDSGIWTNGGNPIDACVEMILKLHGLNLL